MNHKFAYVSFVNFHQNYIDLMKSTILSVLHFSKHPFIIYCVNFPLSFISKNITEIFDTNDDDTTTTKRIILRFITNHSITNIYYFKPYVIADALKQGLEAGYYIESDDILTPFADDFLNSKLSLISYIPLSPIHPDDVNVPSQDMSIASCEKKTQHYIHGHVLFTHNCLPFILQWLSICISSSPHHSFRNADETVLNIMYWKYNCENHFLPIIDPWYENFYTSSALPSSFFSSSICSFHGCKNPETQYQLFLDMKTFFS
jgi:hypothetical protein